VISSVVPSGWLRAKIELPPTNILKATKTLLWDSVGLRRAACMYTQGRVIPCTSRARVCNDPGKEVALAVFASSTVCNREELSLGLASRRFGKAVNRS